MVNVFIFIFLPCRSCQPVQDSSLLSLLPHKLLGYLEISLMGLALPCFYGSIVVRETQQSTAYYHRLLFHSFDGSNLRSESLELISGPTVQVVSILAFRRQSTSPDASDPTTRYDEDGSTLEPVAVQRSYAVEHTSNQGEGRFGARMLTKLGMGSIAPVVKVDERVQRREIGTPNSE